MTTALLPSLGEIPNALPLEGAVRIELEEGVPIFRVSQAFSLRIDALLDKMKGSGLSEIEEAELERFEEVDDYLSFVNRLVRNQFLMQSRPAS